MNNMELELHSPQDTLSVSGTLSIPCSRMSVLREGMRDGLPIGLGYFAVAFSLGIAARSAGLTPLQGFLASILCNASAGQYAGFAAIAADAPY